MTMDEKTVGSKVGFDGRLLRVAVVEHMIAGGELQDAKTRSICLLHRSMNTGREAL